MKNILITDLSEKVLEEIYATGWTPKYKDRYRTEGVKPIVKYFNDNGLLYYDKKAMHEFVVQTYQKYLSGKINKSRWQSIRKCSAFMSQMVTEIPDESESADMTEENAEITADEVIPDEDGAEITVAYDGEFPFDEGESESSEAEEFPTEDSGEFPFDEGEGACFPVEDDEIPSFCFGEDDQDDDESEDEDEDEDEDYEAYMGGMMF